MKSRDLTKNNILKNIKLQAAILLVVFVILYKPPIVEAIGNLFRSTFYAVTDIQSFRVKLKTPHAGEYVLPAAVQEMLALLRTHHLDSYQISAQMEKAENGEIYQRIVESAWPRRISPKSNNKFIFISELNDASICVEKHRGKEVALVLCN